MRPQRLSELRDPTHQTAQDRENTIVASPYVLESDRAIPEKALIGPFAGQDRLHPARMDQSRHEQEGDRVRMVTERVLIVPNHRGQLLDEVLVMHRDCSHVEVEM